MNLEINKSYVIFTTSEYILNKKVRVLGYIGYDRASQYQSFVENVAINEKFIETAGDTIAYLKHQIFYDCGEIELQNGEWVLTGKHYILFDDIIDTDRTQKLAEDHTYQLSFAFKDLEPTDSISEEDVIDCIMTAVAHKYNLSKEKVTLTLTKVDNNSLNTAETQLKEARLTIEDAVSTLKSFVSLQDKCSEIITEFEDNDISTKVNTIGTNLIQALANTETLISRTS